MYIGAQIRLEIYLNYHNYIIIIIIVVNSARKRRAPFSVSI